MVYAHDKNEILTVYLQSLISKRNFKVAKKWFKALKVLKVSLMLTLVFV